MQRLLSRVTLISPVSNLLGGISLIISGLIPGGSPAHPSQKAVTAAPGSAAISEAPQNPDTTIDWERTRKLFADMGWTLSTVGLFTGCVNGVSLGYVSRQPSMVLASVCNLITVPFLLVDPTVTARTAMWLFTGPWLAGYATKVKNDFGRKPGDPALEFDMAPLINLAALREKAAASGSPGSLGRTWVREAGRMFKFVGEDHVRIVQDASTTVSSALKNPGASARATRQALQEIYEFIKGQRKTPPEALRPSPLQNQLGAMLLYSGTLPILFLGGESGAVTEACTKLIAAGILSANTALFATAIQEKDKMLTVALPLSVVGNAFMHTNIGMGVSQIAGAGIQNYFRKEIARGAASGSDKGQAQTDTSRTPDPTAR